VEKKRQRSQREKSLERDSIIENLQLRQTRGKGRVSIHHKGCMNIWVVKGFVFHCFSWSYNEYVKFVFLFAAVILSILFSLNSLFLCAKFVVYELWMHMFQFLCTVVYESVAQYSTYYLYGISEIYFYPISISVHLKLVLFLLALC